MASQIKFMGWVPQSKKTDTQAHFLTIAVYCIGTNGYQVQGKCCYMYIYTCKLQRKESVVGKTE